MYPFVSNNHLLVAWGSASEDFAHPQPQPALGAVLLSPESRCRPRPLARVCWGPSCSWL